MKARHLIPVLAIAVGAILPLAPASANSGGAEPLVHQDWSFDGPFGTYDKASLQRGLKIYREVCAGCHSLKRVYFRNLEGIGYNEEQIKAIASQYTVQDGPNDEGEMFDRPAKPSDYIPSPFPNDNAAKSANNGALPPDLSLITKAREDGANYVFSLLTGFEAAPHGVEMSETQHWNKYFPGHKISMPPPLSPGQVSYADDGSPETLEQYAKDISHFLTWAADPYMEERKRTGVKVILFLLVFAGIMLGLKKKTWADLH
ncbi:MAG: cytochrome c1 [Alphaproteobacteria bacterium]|nr:cytochrome c1 [Alphaproteobacteria bacterium]